jgi:hypothetical protein
MPRAPAPPLLGEGLVWRRVTVSAPDAMLVKGLVEAHEGIASVFAESGGELTLAAPADRERELEDLLHAIDELLAARPPR